MVDDLTSFAEKVSDDLLQADIATLTAVDFDDNLAAILAAEHVARGHAICRCMGDQTLARNLLLMLARHLISEANVINEKLAA